MLKEIYRLGCYDSIHISPKPAIGWVDKEVISSRFWNHGG